MCFLLHCFNTTQSHCKQSSLTDCGLLNVFKSLAGPHMTLKESQLQGHHAAAGVESDSQTVQREGRDGLLSVPAFPIAAYTARNLCHLASSLEASYLQPRCSCDSRVTAAAAGSALGVCILPVTRVNQQKKRPYKIKNKKIEH